MNTADFDTDREDPRGNGILGHLDNLELAYEHEEGADEQPVAVDFDLLPSFLEGVCVFLVRQSPEVNQGKK